MQRTFFDLIRMKTARRDGALLVSYIERGPAYCDRVAIIKEGRIVKTQKISELASSFKKVSFTVKEGKPEGLPSRAQNIEITDNTVSFLFHGDCNLLLSEIAKHPLSNVDISNRPRGDFHALLFPVGAVRRNMK